MTASDIPQLRLDNQHIALKDEDDPAQVVAWLGAVQAQDYSGGLWAVGLRTRTATEKDVERAIADKSIVRTWPMRGTLHFVAAADVRWMLTLLAPRILARNALRLRQQYRLDDSVIAHSRKVLMRALRGGRQLTRPAMYQALEAAHISAAGQRGLQILWRLAQEGLICFGPREGRQPTFVLLDEWLPRGRSLDRDEALLELARRYFTSHGPATLQDFAWWSGLAMAEAKAGLDMAQSQLIKRDMDGQRYWMAESRSTSHRNAPAAYLLPNYDEYIVGYADRSAVFEARHAAGLDARHNPVFNHTIVFDGLIAGTWKRTVRKSTVLIEAKPFASFTRAQQRALAAAADRYASFLELPAALV